ncbi:MAG: hypothetical protein A2V69_03500 [Candidatus Portnoybacteria bacterium RBG_13_40_8]|uniref:Uncharacterized protein n=1 Tax=Candidatus Portnoybacteria bacterium RBG_13_40_8 TaxID=1801990 RepID=A0A1G2F4I3_9BACT|nr:MAG: hypothetical protein A2V69_03500 [Candidatus Portnoybacteria bacterium RBG_13_40_8]
MNFEGVMASLGLLTILLISFFLISPFLSVMLKLFAEFSKPLIIFVAWAIFLVPLQTLNPNLRSYTKITGLILIIIGLTWDSYLFIKQKKGRQIEYRIPGFRKRPKQI